MATIFLTLSPVWRRACVVAVPILSGASIAVASPIDEWAADWVDVRCVRVVWDAQSPSANIADATWQMHRMIVVSEARWPDAWRTDVSISTDRAPLDPKTFSSNEVFRRVTSQITRNGRQPNGMTYHTTKDHQGKGVVLLGTGRPDLHQPPADLFGYVPVLLAKWAADMRSTKNAIAIISESDEAAEYEIVEISMAFTLQRDRSGSGKWYLSALSRRNESDEIWWKATYSEPGRVGESQRIVAMKRSVELTSKPVRLGEVVMPPPPVNRVDHVLSFEVLGSCDDAKFTESTDDASVVRRMTDPRPPNSPGVQEIPGQTSNGGVGGFSTTWLIAGLGVGLIATGVIVAFRRR